MAEQPKTSGSPSPGASQTTKTTAPANPAVASASNTGQGASLPGGNSAHSLAMANGGQPGGKPRKDGLAHGSAEAIAADRKKAAATKAAQRARAKAALPQAPLPPRPQPVPGQGPQTVPVDFSPPDTESIEMVPWDGADIAPALVDALALLEEADKLGIQGKLTKANCPPETIRELMNDAKWPERSKSGIAKYGGNALAKGLNALGISAKHRDVVLIAPSIAYLIYDRAKLHKRLDDLIKAANPQLEKKP